MQEQGAESHLCFQKRSRIVGVIQDQSTVGLFAGDFQRNFPIRAGFNTCASGDDDKIAL